MKIKHFFPVVLTIVSLWLSPAFAAISGVNAADYSRSYDIQKISDGIFAAIAQPKGKAASNAMIVVTSSQVIVIGAHFVPDGINELMAEIEKVTTVPLTTVVLTHHHRGYNYVDYDFPPNIEIIASWQTWQALKESYRELKNPVTFFEKGLTMQRGKTTIIVSNTGQGHTDGDVIAYLPEEKLLFTSDLFFNDVVGYMGDGHLREWVLNVEMLQGIDARTVIPGLGKVTGIENLQNFHTFFREFTTEVLRHLEQKKSLEQTKKNFRLPKYEKLPGYREFFNQNVERAFKQLKEQ